MNENINENDDYIIVAFAYKSDHLSEIECKFEYVNEINQKSKSSDNFNHVAISTNDFKTDKNNFKFEKFSLPDIIVPKNPIFSDFKKKYCIFYNTFVKTEKKSFKIIQKCDRGFSNAGKSDYYSGIIGPNGQNFMFNFEFESNYKNFFHKEPNGGKIDSKTDQLLMFLSFIWLKNSKELFKTLNKFINECKINNQTNLKGDQEINRYIRFIFKFYKNDELYFANKPSPDENVNFLCCLLGYLDLKSYNQICSTGLELCSNILEEIMSNLEKNSFSKVQKYDDTFEYFKMGLNTIFYVCLKNKVESLINYVKLISKLDIENYEKLIKSFSDNRYSYSNRMDFNFVVGNKIQSDDSNEKRNILNCLIHLCPDIETFFSLSHYFRKEQEFQELIGIEDNKNFIKERFFSDQSFHNNRDFSTLLKNFDENLEILHNFKIDFYNYVIKKNKDFQTTINLIERERNKSEEKSSRLWKKFMEQILKRINDFDYDILDRLISNILTGKDDSEEEKCREEIKSSIIEKIKRYQPPFNYKEKEILSKFLNNRNVFPFGSIKIIDEFFKHPKFCIKDAVFFLYEILFVQFNIQVEKKNWFVTFKNIFKVVLNESSKIPEYEEILKKLNEKIAKIEHNERRNELIDLIYKLFLETYFNKNNKNFECLIDLMNYPSIFGNEERSENVYIEFADNQFHSKFKTKNKEETFVEITQILDLIKENKNELKSKMLSKIFAFAENNYNENVEKIKKLLYENPDRNHFLFKVIELSNSYIELNKLPFIINIKENIRKCVNDLIEKNIFEKDILFLKEIKNQNEKIKVLEGYIDSAYINDYLTKKTNIKFVIGHTIKFYDENINEIESVFESLEFLKEISLEGLVNRHHEILSKLITKKSQLPIKDIVLPSGFNEFLESTLIFSPCTFKDLRYSNIFRIIYLDCFDKFGKKIERLELIDIPKIFVNVLECYKKFGDKLKKQHGELTNDDAKKFFGQIQKNDSNKELSKEISILKKITNSSDNDFKFSEKFILNYSKIEEDQNFFKSILECFKIFALKDNGDLRATLRKYLDLVSQDKYTLKSLNDLLSEIDGKIDINQIKNSEIYEIILELSKTENLWNYLKNKNEDELNVIDFVDPIGDKYIRVQNIEELITVNQFMKKIKIGGEWSNFLHSLKKNIEEDTNGVFRNISTLTLTSNCSLGEIRLFIDNIQNREETLKHKICDITKSSKFVIVFNDKTKSFNLITDYRKKIELNLNDLNDLRDRALLIISNHELSEKILTDEKFNLKENYDTFIKTIESLNNIIDCMNSIYENGYPIDEIHNKKELLINDGNKQEILNFQKEMSEILENWNKHVTNLMNRFKILNYFWGSEFFLIEKCLRKKEHNQVKEHLSYVNFNIMNKSNDSIPEYPNIEKQSPNERLEILAKYLNNLITSIPNQTRLKMNDSIELKSTKPNANQIILFKSEYIFFTNAILICFERYENFYPVLNQLLFCQKSTTCQEIQSFIFRLVSNDDNVLFAIIGPERLNFNAKDFFLDLVEKLSIVKSLRLAIITSDFTNHIVEYFNEQNTIKAQYHNDQNNKQLIRSLIEKWQKDITCVTSLVSGQGKTTYIRQKAKSTNSKIITLPISECNYKVFAKMLNKIKAQQVNGLKFNLHIDLCASNDNQSLNEFIFIISMLKIFKFNQFIFITTNISHFYIEIANNFEECLRKNVLLNELVENVHIDRFSIDDLILIESNQDDDQINYVQVVCNYLQLIENNELNQKEFKKNEISNNYDIPFLDKDACRNLLGNYLKKENVRFNSFIQFRNFIDLAGYYLIKFSENLFLSIDTLNYLIEGLRNNQLKNIYLGLRQSVIYLILNRSVIGATQFIDSTRQDALRTFKIQNRLNADNHEIEMNAQQYLMNHFKFNECNYLLVVFSEISGFIHLVYSKKSLIPRNIVSFFKLQDPNIANMRDGQILELLKNENDLSIFKDYENEDHTGLLKILSEIFKSSNNLEIEFEKFKNDKSDEQIKEIFKKFEFDSKLELEISKFVKVYNEKLNEIKEKFKKNQELQEFVEDCNKKIIEIRNLEFEFENFKNDKTFEKINENFKNREFDAPKFKKNREVSEFVEVYNKEIKEIFKKLDLDAQKFKKNGELSKFVENYNKKINAIVKKFGFDEEQLKKNNEISKISGYRLTADNFLKMIIIYNKIRANLPVVIMGETGCGKTYLIYYLALQLLNVKLVTFNIHAGISQSSFIKEIEKYFLIADSYQNDEIWIFFDEFNTSECMYLISEMICNRTLIGNRIPKNLKLLAACNPYKIKSKSLQVGLVKQRSTTSLLHIVHPLPDKLIDHVWDFGALTANDEKKYVDSMIKNLKCNNHKMLIDLICYSQRFICKKEEASSVSLRDVDRFRIFYDWFTLNIDKRYKIEGKTKVDDKEYEIKCIILSLFICYFMRLCEKENRVKYITGLVETFKKYNVSYDNEKIEQIFTEEQNEYLKRMKVNVGIARNSALRENVFATLICVMNRIPIFICGKPGCSKTLCIQLFKENLKGYESDDAWFKELPKLEFLTYQGSESSTSEGIINIFKKAKEISENSKKNNLKKISVIAFDEMGLAELSSNNPLKVLHSLLEYDNTDIAFIGISNWRLDASKMNRGIFLSRPDLDKSDLEETSIVLLKSFIPENKNINIDENFRDEIYLMKKLANVYHNYKQNLQKTHYPDFHGTRDFYYLIKQISEKIINERPKDKELFDIVTNNIKRNFQGLKDNPIKMIDELKNELKSFNQFQENQKISAIDLINMNLSDDNSRYLMLITKSDSATYILDNFLSKSIKNRITFFGSKFEGDLNSEEYSFRALSDIILYIEKGWTVVLQDMDNIYGSLYDLFNQNFVKSGQKKNCRIALGSVINPMCFVHDEFHCIIILQEDLLSKCEPPFLNRFEKQILNFDVLIKDEHSKLIKELKDWISLLFDLSHTNSMLKLQNIVANFTDETLASLVIFNYSNDQTYEQILLKCKHDLIKVCSNFSLISACESTMNRLNEEKVKSFISDYKNFFENNQNLNTYVSNVLNQQLKQEGNLKSVVYTFDPITKAIKLDIKELDEIKIGIFDSEKFLAQAITKYYTSDKKLLIVRLEWNDHAKHLQLIKFLIEKIIRDNYGLKNKKMFVIVIHLNFYAYKSDLEKYKMSYLSDWDQIMLDKLDDKSIGLTDILFSNSNELIRNENFFRFEDVSYDLFVNTIKKLDYRDRLALGSEQFDLLINEHKTNIIENLTKEENPNDLFNSVKTELKRKILPLIPKDTNWRLELLNSESFLSISYDINFLLKHLLKNQLNFLFVETVYSIEKYFPFDSIMSHRQDQSMRELFQNIFLELLNGKNDNQVKNADHANIVDVIFGLKIPFILKEVEKFTMIKSIPKKLEDIKNLENEMKYLNPLIDQNDQLFQKEASLRNITLELINVFDTQSIYSQYVKKSDQFLNLYLADLVKVKFSSIFKWDNVMIDVVNSILDILIASQKNFLEIVDSSSGLYFYVVEKYQNYISQSTELLSKFKDVIDMKILIQYIKSKNFDENDLRILNYHFLADKLLVFMLNFVFVEQIHKCSDLEGVKNFDFNRLVEFFKILNNEFSKIRLNYKLAIESHSRFYFIAELVKFLDVKFSNNQENGVLFIQNISSLIVDKLKNDEFLSNLNILDEIILLLKRCNDENNNLENETLNGFENFLYSLAITSSNDASKIKNILDKFYNNKHSTKISSSLIQKIINNFNITIDLEFLNQDNAVLDALNDKIKEIGFDSSLSIVFTEVLFNNIDDIDFENYFSWLDENHENISILYDFLKHNENGFQNERINNIRNKNIASLASIAYLKKIIYHYCMIIVKREYIEESSLLNEILLSQNYKFSNSFRIYTLKIFYKQIGSYSILKEFLFTNSNIKWKDLIDFGETKGILDIKLKSRNLEEKINSKSRQIQGLIDSRMNDKSSIDKFDGNLKNDLNSNEKLAVNLAFVNTLYFSRTNEDFNGNQSTRIFSEYYLKKLSENEPNKRFIKKLISNFENDEWLKARHNKQIDEFKLISVIMHTYSIAVVYSHLSNGFTFLFHDSDQNYWIINKDHEEYEILNALKNLPFLSYSQEEIARGLYSKNPGFALYKCSDECNYYYTVTNCTNVIPNNKDKCSKGHLLGGQNYGRLHQRPGHKKIENAKDFIQQRLKVLSENPYKSYVPHNPNNDITYSVQSLKPLTYRILHLILHSNLYMLMSTQFFAEDKLKIILGFEKHNFKENDISKYLKTHIENDFEIIGKLLATNEQYIFIHSILYELPQFIEKNNLPLKTAIDKNNFEKEFEREFINPKLTCSNDIILNTKKLLKFEQNDEIMHLLNEFNEESFIGIMILKYPLIKQMRIHREISLDFFENKFNTLNLSPMYPVIDLYLKNRLSFEKLSILPLLVKITNSLINEYNHKISRNKAREKTVVECLDRNLQNDFNKLKELWNKHLNKNGILKDGCKEYDGIMLKDESPLSLLLIDNKPEIGSGIQTRMSIQYLANFQNEFLENVLSNSENVNILKYFSRDLLPIELITKDYVIEIEKEEFDFENCLKFYFSINPEYGKSSEIDFEYDKLEMLLINKLIVGKRLLNTDKENFKTIQYNGELLNNKVRLIENIRTRIPQEPIAQEKKTSLLDLINELKKNRENNEYEILSNIFSSLNSFICFMDSSLSNRHDTTLKEYSLKLKLKNISDYFKTKTELATLSLKNIIEVYELFENEMFYLMNHQFDEKYKKDLDEPTLREFSKFLDQCDGIVLPSKLDFYNAMKRFCMRCLFADLDEDQNISIYLCFRPDLWPADNFEEKLERFQEKFIFEIKLKHSLGNIMKKLDGELKDKDNHLSRNNQVNARKTNSNQRNNKFMTKKFMI